MKSRLTNRKSALAKAKHFFYFALLFSKATLHEMVPLSETQSPDRAPFFVALRKNSKELYLRANIVVY